MHADCFPIYSSCFIPVHFYLLNSVSLSGFQRQDPYCKQWYLADADYEYLRALLFL